MKALAILVVLLLLLAILFVTLFGKMMFADLTGHSYSESATFTLNRDISIEIRSGEISWACDIPAPQNINNANGGIQTIQSAVPNPLVPATEKYGDDWIMWDGSDDSTVNLRMTYKATVRTVIWGMDAEDSGMVSDIPAALVAQQGGNEWELKDSNGNPTGEYMIWPEHQTIASLSQDLTSDRRTVYEKIQYVYNYVNENMDYQTIPGSEPKACLQTLADGTGDCDDQSILLISLLRAAGIPSWLAFGMLYDQGQDVWGAHAWVEVYIPLISGTSGSVAIDVVNDEFLVRNCNRLEEWKSDGNGEHLSDYYHLLSYNYTMANPHQQPPVVVLGDSYSGEYEASSGKVYELIDPLDLIDVVSENKLLVSRKVF